MFAEKFGHTSKKRTSIDASHIPAPVPPAIPMIRGFESVDGMIDAARAGSTIRQLFKEWWLYFKGLRQCFF